MDPEVIAGLGAVGTAIASCLMAWAAVIKAKKETKSEAEKECQERLRETRRQAEELAEQYHQLKMRQYSGIDQRPEEVTADDILERWSHLE